MFVRFGDISALWRGSFAQPLLKALLATTHAPHHGGYGWTRPRFEGDFMRRGGWVRQCTQNQTYNKKEQASFFQCMLCVNDFPKRLQVDCRLKIHVVVSVFCFIISLSLCCVYSCLVVGLASNTVCIADGTHPTGDVEDGPRYAVFCRCGCGHRQGRRRAPGRKGTHQA